MSNSNTRPQQLPRRPPVETPRPVYQESAVEKELKQRTANVLCDHSLLLLNALTMNETPTKARLRSFRHLTGQPQPPHDHAPAKRKHKEPEGASGSAHTNAGRTTGSAWTPGASGGASAARAMDPTSGQSSRHRREAIPLDDEFGHTIFQGAL
ncbi:hypothetical protein EMPS_00984 [Entomortierella parvispora]|uniref:Uncharacterized protein n=1 Tax=Entomortierella parvispora TaxID=205924 RepID=A0A9P3H2P6_9FUNG|nr:hypothetical protein EMPS_00984 [Entomortierella parvispora]